MATEIDLAELRRRSDSNSQLASRPGAWLTLDVPAQTMFDWLRARVAALPAETPVHEPEFMLFRNFDGENSLFVDIGANMGQSAASLHAVNKTARIVSFEINPLLFPVLQHWRDYLPDFECFNFGLSDASTYGMLYVPVFGKFLCTPYASLRREVLESANRRADWKKMTSQDAIEVLALPVTLRRLDEMELNPDFVKIDVEGAELFVLRGMEATLTRCRPIVMCEKSSDRTFIRWMNERGFLHFSYSRSGNALSYIGDGPLNWLNILFVHPSRFDLLKNKGIKVSGVPATRSILPV